MPQITVKGLTDKQMRAISTPLIPKLAEAIGCPEDWLILELAHSSFYAGGEQVPGFPIVEVSWFDRPDEVRERVAEILRDTVMGKGYPLVQVIFTTLVEERFYEYEQEESFRVLVGSTDRHFIHSAIFSDIIQNDLEFVR